MTDLISRQAAIDICNYAADLWHGQLGEGIVIAVRKRIEQLPSSQPEIIRCCECKHHHRDKSGAYYCGRKEYGYGWGMNDFCSDAERKEN